MSILRLFDKTEYHLSNSSRELYRATKRFMGNIELHKYNPYRDCWEDVVDPYRVKDYAMNKLLGMFLYDLIKDASIKINKKRV